MRPKEPPDPRLHRLNLISRLHDHAFFLGSGADSERLTRYSLG